MRGVPISEHAAIFPADWFATVMLDIFEPCYRIPLVDNLVVQVPEEIRLPFEARISSYEA